MREIEASDWKAFSHFMTQASYQRHIAMRLRNEDDVKNFVTRQVARQGDERRHIFHLAAEDKKRSLAVGDGFIILGRGGLAEIGWGVAPDLWGRGYGTELARLLTAMAVERLGALAVTCKVMAPNLASRRVAEKVGYLPDGTIATFTTNDGRQVTVHLFKVTRDHYFEAPY